MIALIPFLTFLVPFSISIKRKNRLASTIIGLFVFSAFCSLLINTVELPTHKFEKDNPAIFLLYSLLLVPFLFLSLKLKPFNHLLQLPSGRLFNFILVILACGAFYSLFYLFPYMLVSLSVNSEDLRFSLAETAVLPSNLLTTIAVGFPTFCNFYAFLFYICIIKRKPFIFILAMFVGVLSFVVNVFVFAGRDGVFFAFFAFVLGYLLFEPLLNKAQIKTLKKVFIVALGIGLFYIIKITKERFSSSGEFDFSTFKAGIVGYLGVQPFIFSDWLNHQIEFNYGINDFSVFLKFIGVEGKRVIYIDEPYQWMFGTFLANFYAVSGLGSLFGLTFIFWFFFRIQIYRLDRTPILGALFLLSFYFFFIISGAFYYRLSFTGGNYFILISVFAILILFKKNKVKIKQRIASYFNV